MKSANATILHVGEGQTYSTISDAVIAAASGDTIMVHDGTYTENVNIDVSLTVKSLNGYETTLLTTPVDWEDIFDVTADNVTIEGFSFYGVAYGNGVHFYGVSNCLIQNCRSGWSEIYINQVGISIGASESIIVNNNICSYNNNAGIYAHGSNYITISNNTCNYCQHSIYTEICGIMMYATSDCHVHNNVCNYNDRGIFYCYNNWHDTITKNECQFNDEYGLYAYFQYSTYFSNNIFSNNNDSGVFLSGGYQCVFAGNKIESNSVYGMDLYYNTALTLYLNTLNNTENFHFVVNAGDNDQILKPPTKMAYRIYDTTFKNFLGNYYNDYTGEDADMNGIGDTPHISDQIIDDYPLTNLPEDYMLLTWFLNNVEMTRNDMGTIGGLVNIPELSSHIWVADESVLAGLTFPTGIQIDSTSWTGQMIYTYNQHPDMLIEIGIWDGSSFTPGGPQVQLDGFQLNYTHNYATPGCSFTIPAGQYLAMRTTINNIDRDFNFRMGGTWAYISAPIGSPDYPGDPVGVQEIQTPEVLLRQNYPNPFNPAVAGAGRSPGTTISFSLNTENTEDTELVIYNIKGQKIKTFSNLQIDKSPNQQIIWNGTDENNNPVSSGIYFYKLQTGNITETRKMLLLK